MLRVQPTVLSSILRDSDESLLWEIFGENKKNRTCKNIDIKEAAECSKKGNNSDEPAYTVQSVLKAGERSKTTLKI